MKISVIFPMLLLVWSVSTDQNMTEADDNTPAQQIAYPMTFQQEIQVVLREMSSSLANQKIEMRFLRRETQEQAGKLKLLEGQKTELERQKAELEKQKTGLDTLMQQIQVQKVAFSASLLAGQAAQIGPFKKHTKLVFEHVTTNIGNAYNPITGVFTAPVKGAYHFEWYLTGHGSKGFATGGALVKNSEHIFLAFETQASGHTSPSNGVTLLLEVGDFVFVHQWYHTYVYDDGSHQTTFSGHLLFTM